MTKNFTLVVFNPLPYSARGKAVQTLCDRLDAAQRKYLLVATDADKHVTALNIAHYLPRAKELIVVGGDGTLHQVVHALGDKHPDLELGYIPAGTGNDFARSWFGKRLSIPDYIEHALYGEGQRIDLGLVNDCYFVNSVGIGFDGDLTRRLDGRKTWWPKLTYLLSAVKQLFLYRGGRLKITGSDPALTMLNNRNCLLFVVANNRYFGAGMNIAPHADPADGELAWVHIKECRLGTKLQSFSSIYSGKHLNKSVVTYGQLKQVTVQTSHVPMQADGEYIGCTPAVISSIPGAILMRK